MDSKRAIIKEGEVKRKETESLRERTKSGDKRRKMQVGMFVNVVLNY